MNKEFVEGLKELVRTALMGGVSYLLTGGVLQSIVTYFFSSRLSPEMIVILTGLLTSILSGLDKWNHKEGNKSPLDLKSMDVLKK